MFIINHKCYLDFFFLHRYFYYRISNLETWVKLSNLFNSELDGNLSFGRTKLTKK